MTDLRIALACTYLGALGFMAGAFGGRPSLMLAAALLWVLSIGLYVEKCRALGVPPDRRPGEWLKGRDRRR